MKLVKFTQDNGGPIYINADLVFMLACPENEDNPTYVLPAVGRLDISGAFDQNGIWVEGSLDTVAMKLQTAG